MREPKTRVKYLIVYRLRIQRRHLTRPLSQEIRAKDDKRANAIYQLWKKRKPGEFVDVRLFKKTTSFKQLA